MVATDPSHVADRFEGNRRRRGLPLALADLVPDGAAAGRVGHVALTPAVVPIPFTRLEPAWLALHMDSPRDRLLDRIHEALPHATPDARSRLRALLADPGLRLDGLPRYEGCHPMPPAAERALAAIGRALGVADKRRIDGRPRMTSGPGPIPSWQQAEWALRHPQAGADIRAVIAAVLTDIGGVPLVPRDDVHRWADGQPLDLSAGPWVGIMDHRQVFAGRVTFKGKPDKLYKVRTRGRKILAAVGAWPWAHAPAGKLPADWQTCAEFVDPLTEWREAARRSLGA